MQNPINAEIGNLTKYWDSTKETAIRTVYKHQRRLHRRESPLFK